MISALSPRRVPVRSSTQYPIRQAIPDKSPHLINYQPSKRQISHEVLNVVADAPDLRDRYYQPALFPLKSELLPPLTMPIVTLPEQNVSQVEIEQAIRSGIGRYFDDCRARVPAFIDRHFHYPGAIATNRMALGWDMLRAPINLLWAPVYALACLVKILVPKQAGLMWLHGLVNRGPAEQWPASWSLYWPHWRRLQRCPVLFSTLSRRQPAYRYRPPAPITTTISPKIRLMPTSLRICPTWRPPSWGSWLATACFSLLKGAK